MCQSSTEEGHSHRNRTDKPGKRVLKEGRRRQMDMIRREKAGSKSGLSVSMRGDLGTALI